MPVASVFRSAPSCASARPLLPETCVLAVAAVLIVLGAAGPVPPLAVVALAGAAASTLAGVRLSRLTLGPDPAAGPPAGRLARRRAARPRRAAALLHAAVVTAGLTAAVLPLASAGYRPAAAAAGLAGTGALLGGGLFSLHRSRRSVRGRLHRLLDQAAPGVCLVLTAWLLLPYAGVPAPVRLAVAVALGLLAVDALAVLTGAGRDGGTARCRGGSALTLFALVLLAGLPAGPAGGRVALLAVPPLVVGVLLVAAGVRQVAQPAPARRTALAWPRAVLPPVAVALAAVHQLQAGLLPDRTAVLLALAVVPPLVVRQLVDTAAATSSDESAAARTRCPRRHRHPPTRVAPQVAPACCGRWRPAPNRPAAPCSWSTCTSPNCPAGWCATTSPPRPFAGPEPWPPTTARCST
ncbi:hypothetical protein [Verrucosispora sioxanthis]|uniref:hypothetical protein n=1 Tax=Verrucosispora sioxanthis TaxID=2499994 RepID=UPI001F3F8148|nr:hypothetical protein [Verrucosispora sioxanthis]